jgi:hypothetical protein
MPSTIDADRWSVDQTDVGGAKMDGGAAVIWSDSDE